jgi:hypothetical protein
LGKDGGFLAGKDQVSYYHTDPGAVQGGGNPAVEGPFAGMEEEMEKGIEVSECFRIYIEAGEE